MTEIPHRQLVSDLGEFGLISRWASLLGPTGADVVVGIGDDAAVLKHQCSGLLLVTTDMLVENVHFRLDLISPEQLGWKAVAVNVSDIAAVGGEPAFAFISIGMPAHTPVSFTDALYHGMKLMAHSVGAQIVGGDTVGSDKLIISIALTGRVEENHLALRSGAKPGDALVVTGTLGDSAAGLRLLLSGKGENRFKRCIDAHLTPQPRLPEARAAVATGAVHAMIDLSDGLSGDLRHLCTSSNVGALLSEDALPISAEAREAASLLGISPTELALSGGEDYELLMAVDLNRVDDVDNAINSVGRVRATCIGTVQAAKDLLIRRSTGETVPLAASSWDHFAIRNV
ncbi:MAG: thiamine-phosphate kinase [Armatimonadota bacterium]